MKYLFPLFAFLLLFSCNSQYAQTKQNSQSKYAVIQYTSTSYFDINPNIAITINSDRTAALEVTPSNSSKINPRSVQPQKLQGTIKKEDYNKLVYLLNSIDFKNLPPYKPGDNMVNGRRTAILKLKLTDGTTEKIEDYGKNKTEKLVEVYRFIEDLRNNQEWRK